MVRLMRKAMSFQRDRSFVKADVVESEEKERKVSLTMLDEKRIGMVRVLWQIANDVNLADTLKEVFPRTWKAILSVAFFYVSSGRNAAYLFEGWKEDHETPLGHSISRTGISQHFSNR